MTDFNNAPITEGTNMMVDMLANSEKIRSQDVWYYDKNNDDVDDNFNDYISQHNDDTKTTYDNDKHGNENNNTYNNTNANTDNNDKSYHSDSKPVKSETNKFIDEEYESLSPLEKRLRRLDIMRALGELRDLGCKVTNYNIDDDYYMMKYELDLHRSIRAKRNWLGLYSHMLIGGVKFVELINNSYNPFDFSLRGLSDEVNADKNTYYEILGEIYEFHNVPGKKMNPWFRLFVSLIGVVVVVGGKNNAHKFMPNQSKKLEEDADFIENLRARAAKDSQSKLSHRSNQQNQQNQQTQQTQQNHQFQNNQQNQNNLDDYMNKQHAHAVQKTKDLEELKRQELEYQRYQQMLAEQQNKFNNIKKNLEMSASARSPTKSDTRSASQSARSKSQSYSQSQSRSSRSRKSPREQDTISEMSTNTSHSTRTSQSTVSQISINKNLAKKLSAENKKRTKDISVEQISFGSNKKK